VESGLAQCVFDPTGPAPTVGHYVVASGNSGHGGQCLDSAAYPSGSQPVGMIATIPTGGLPVVFVFPINTSPGAVTIGTAPVTSISSGNVQIATGNATSGNSGGIQLASGATTTSGNSGAVTINSGAAAGTSGNVRIDAGNGTSASGQIQIGTTHASAVALGSASSTTTNNGALQVNGLETIGVAGTTPGSLSLANGAPSGKTVTIAPSPALTTANWTMTLPTSAGTSGYVLATDGSGVTSWSPSTLLGTSAAATSPQISGSAGNGFYTSGSNTVDLAIGGSNLVTWTSGGEVISSSAAAGITVHENVSGFDSNIVSENDAMPANSVGSGLAIRGQSSSLMGGFHAYWTSTSTANGASSAFWNSFDGVNFDDLVTLSSGTVIIGNSTMLNSSHSANPALIVSGEVGGTVTSGTGGAGAAVTITAGSGGQSALATGSNTGGAGGAISVTAGSGGTCTYNATGSCTTGNGGSITLTPGNANGGYGSVGTAGLINLNGNTTTAQGYSYGCTHGGFGPTCGVATLSGGTVTVSTTAISSLSTGTNGSAISLTLQSCPSSHCGILYINTVTPGTSFQIESTNTSDSSSVFWEIKTIN
jgi:hypothetical protein